MEAPPIAPTPVAPPVAPIVEEEYTPGFAVSHQKLEIEVDFANQKLLGRTEITILPQTRDLKELRFDARQCEIPANGATVNGRPAVVSYENPYKRLDIPHWLGWTADNHEMQRDKLKPLLQTKSAPGELSITIPRGVRIEDLNRFPEQAPNAVKDRALGAVRSSSTNTNGILPISATTPILTPKTGEDQTFRYSPLIVSIQFSVKRFRDGVHWVGLEEGDLRYPHVYTMHSLASGVASCIFPCIDDPAMRSTWEISIKCSRTLGAALKRPSHTPNGTHIHGSKHHRTHGEVNGHTGISHQDELDLNTEDKLLEMNVICTGELTEEVSDPQDSSKKIVSFLCSNQVAPRHIGFVVGPFEQIDLTEFREDEGNDKLGQKAVKIYGYCLPGRAEELRNTCESMAYAADHFEFNFSSYPFSDFKLCFVEDQISDTVPLASLTICSTRLLIPEDIIDPEVEVTRQLMHALASQWIGVSIIANSRADTWVIVGASHFMADHCMQKLCGNNPYRFRYKTLSDKLVELDIQRPSIYALGEILHLGQFEVDFMELKAPLVLFILDRRLTKLSGSAGVARVISKMLVSASTGEQLSEKTFSTEAFRRGCEKLGHHKLDTFFNQWVLGAGCPRFHVVQRFNKKRLTVEMTIKQTQDNLPAQRKLEKEAFLREFKEETNGVYAGDAQPVFTGQMTIRIHEADGTPYEHIVEIREGTQKIEIPYHTKYKRLKRSRREKERATAGPGADISADNHDDVLLYCLGDVLQSREEVAQWGLVDWDAELEQRMDQESYEWIRMDADFEWICEMQMNMPPYMYVSQLQQDRDVVAQQDSMLFLGRAQPHPLVSTILIRTLMDRRYFYGIREMAARMLATHATKTHNWIGRVHLEKAFQEFFCYPGSTMPRSNDFSNKAQYLIKCAIPKAMAHIRDEEGNCPVEARQFILDQLRFNDNGNNEFSDYYYVSTLLTALADSLVPTKKNDGGMSFSFEEDDGEELQRFQQTAIEEIDRYRRMDEWILSYHNIYTTTALACEQKLIKAKVVQPKPARFFAYTHDGTLDLVRIKALEALVDLGYLENDLFLKFFLNILSTDLSPFVRGHCYRIFFMGLGAIAMGEHKQTEPPPPVEDALIVEHDTSLDAKKEMIARTTNIVSALNALKEDLGDNTTFKEEIWAAISSRDISLLEQVNLLEICNILYDPVESMPVILKLPTYWRVQNLGKGVVSFTKSTKVRTKPLPPKLSLKQSKQGATPLIGAAPVVSLNAGSVKTLKRPSPQDRTESTTSERPSKIVKLRVGEGLRRFPHSLPQLPVSQAPMAPPPSLPTTIDADTSAVPKVRIPLPSSARTPLPNSAPPSPSETMKKPSLKLRLSFGPKKVA